MRAFVFTDRALERHAGRFVWLSIDAEKEKNAGFLEKYPIVGFPTFLVIDPDKETAAFRQLGGFSAKDFPKVLDDGERALRLALANWAEQHEAIDAQLVVDAAAAARIPAAAAPVTEWLEQLGAEQPARKGPPQSCCAASF